jgi:hypothetical protein
MKFRNLQDAPAHTEKELFGTQSEDEQEPDAKRLCVANEASLIYRTQGMGYRI